MYRNQRVARMMRAACATNAACWPAATFDTAAQALSARSAHDILSTPPCPPPQLINMEVRPPVQQTQAQPQATDADAPPPPAAASEMKKGAKEAALQKLVADGWLKHAAGPGRYALGVRSFLELGPQLLELADLPDATRDAWQDLM